uniref:Uncharacterized protein n=1 Tax=Lepeophtheirus salmonis TaxID=72036 RepID=A0A0K2V608_LEPSM
MNFALDASFKRHELHKSLQDSILDVSMMSSPIRRRIMMDFKDDIDDFPILAITITSKFSLYTNRSSKTLLIRNRKIDNEEPTMISQWWKDPSIRKLVNIGFIPSYAINAVHASTILVELSDLINKTWSKYFGISNVTPMRFRSKASLSFVNLVLLKIADNKLPNRGLPYGSLVDMNVCKQCGYPEGISPHNHVNKTAICIYPICDKNKGHLLRVCGVLHGFCYQCGQVGHMARSHRLYELEMIKQAYESHREFGILNPIGLEVFALRRNFLSQDEFDPMTINNKSNSYLNRVPQKSVDVIEQFISNIKDTCFKEDYNLSNLPESYKRLSFNMDDTDLSYIWGMEEKNDLSINRSFDRILKETSSPGFFSCDVMPRSFSSLDDSNDELSNSGSEISFMP